jgi:hypothetical protein
MGQNAPQKLVFFLGLGFDHVLAVVAVKEKLPAPRVGNELNEVEVPTHRIHVRRGVDAVHFTNCCKSLHNHIDREIKEMRKARVGDQ